MDGKWAPRKSFQESFIAQPDFRNHEVFIKIVKLGNKFFDTTFALISLYLPPNRPFSTAAQRTDARILKAPILGFTAERFITESRSPAELGQIQELGRARR